MRTVLISLLLCSAASAQQLVPINWEGRNAIIISSKDNNPPLTDEQKIAQGYKLWRYTDGTEYWAKPVMHMQAGGCAAPETQRNPPDD